MELLVWALCQKSKRYRMGNLFFADQGLLDTHCYGETPIITLERIAKKAGITKNSRVLDLGSGAGRASVYWGLTRGCRVLGVDKNSFLVSLSRRLVSGCAVQDRVEFMEADMETLAPQDIDTVYFYHSALDDETIRKVAIQLGYYDASVKIITVSYALAHLLPEYFTVETQFDGWFPWGITWIYIQRPTNRLLTLLAQGHDLT